MKKRLFIIVLPAIAFLICFITIKFDLVYALSARPLSDSELDGIYAKGIDFDVNVVQAFRSAFINQSNIAGLVNLTDRATLVDNYNLALNV